MGSKIKKIKLKNKISSPKIKFHIVLNGKEKKMKHREIKSKRKKGKECSPSFFFLILSLKCTILGRLLINCFGYGPIQSSIKRCDTHLALFLQVELSHVQELVQVQSWANNQVYDSVLDQIILPNLTFIYNDKMVYQAWGEFGFTSKHGLSNSVWGYMYWSCKFLPQGFWAWEACPQLIFSIFGLDLLLENSIGPWKGAHGLRYIKWWLGVLTCKRFCPRGLAMGLCKSSN